MLKALQKKLTKFQIEKRKTSKAKPSENTNIMNLKKSSACEKYCSYLFLCRFIIIMRKMLQIMSNKMKIVSIYTAKCEEKFNLMVITFLLRPVYLSVVKLWSFLVTSWESSVNSCARNICDF